jgi:hypothetical protein
MGLFGINSEETAKIEARINWLSQCAVILVKKAAAALHIELPPSPDDAKPKEGAES